MQQSSADVTYRAIDTGQKYAEFHTIYELSFRYIESLMGFNCKANVSMTYQGITWNLSRYDDNKISMNASMNKNDGTICSVSGVYNKQDNQQIFDKIQSLDAQTLTAALAQYQVLQAQQANVGGG
jgi:hypothetical protein